MSSLLSFGALHISINLPSQPSARFASLINRKVFPCRLLLSKWSHKNCESRKKLVNSLHVTWSLWVHLLERKCDPKELSKESSLRLGILSSANQRLKVVLTGPFASKCVYVCVSLYPVHTYIFLSATQRVHRCGCHLANSLARVLPKRRNKLSTFIPPPFKELRSPDPGLIAWIFIASA